jgi:hypothetical protein
MEPETITIAAIAGSSHLEFLILNHLTQGLSANYIVIYGLKAYHLHRKYQVLLLLDSKVGD